MLSVSTAMTMATPRTTQGINFQVLMVVVFAGLVVAPPVPQCTGYLQSDGTVAYTIPYDFRDRMTHCELDIVIQGIICAIYENGLAQTDWIPPVRNISTNSFTIPYDTTYNKSVEIVLHCPPDPPSKRLCTCDSCINSAQSQSPRTQPPTTEHYLAKNPEDHTRNYRVGVVIFVVVMICGALAWIAFYCRKGEKKDIDCPLRDSSAETSPSSSSEHLTCPPKTSETDRLHDSHGET